MGHFHFIHLTKTQTHAYLLLLSLLLFMSSTQIKYTAEGRPIAKLLGVAKDGEGDQGVVMVEAMIGSRPPRCAGRCTSCGHCVAVQVPLVPQGKGKERIFAKDFSTSITSRSGDEYSSNYKPMNWKCKCGDTILNP